MRPFVSELKYFSPSHVLSEDLSKLLKSSDMQKFLEITPSYADFYFVGGVLRDFLLNRSLNKAIKPRDIDVVVTNIPTREYLYKIYRQDCQCTINAFGGLKCTFQKQGMIFDIWRIEDHINMQNINTPGPIDLLARFLIDVDAIMYHPKSNALYDLGCMRAIKNRSIRFVGALGLSKRYLISQLSHILLAHLRTGFILSPQIKKYVALFLSDKKKEIVSDFIVKKNPSYEAKIEELMKNLMF